MIQNEYFNEKIKYLFFHKSNITQKIILLTMNPKEIIDKIQFNEQGLLPVITQDIKTKAVLMMAWMNKQALFTEPKNKTGLLLVSFS